MFPQKRAYRKERCLEQRLDGKWRLQFAHLEPQMHGQGPFKGKCLADGSYLPRVKEKNLGLVIINEFSPFLNEWLNEKSWEQYMSWDLGQEWKLSMYNQNTSSTMDLPLAFILAIEEEKVIFTLRTFTPLACNQRKVRNSTTKSFFFLHSWP